MGYESQQPRAPAPSAGLHAASATAAAQTLKAVATPSRLLILSLLRREPCTASVPVTDVGMETSQLSTKASIFGRPAVKPIRALPGWPLSAGGTAGNRELP
jgi:hypothetical protein